MGLYIYVIAAAVAVFGILTVFKMNVEKIKEDPDQAERAQQNFFIGVALSESLPIILLIIGIINQDRVSSIEELYLPVLIIIMLMAFSLLFIFLQKKVGVDENSKPFVNRFSYIAMALVFAIPLIALVFMFMSAPASIT